MTSSQRSLVFLFFFVFKLSAYAQSTSTNSSFGMVNTYTPTSPQAAAFQRYGETPVNYNTGVPNISIPLGSLKLKGFEWPLSISYHAGGHKVADLATATGLGWTLQANGVITGKTLGDGWSGPIDKVYNLFNNGYVGGSYCDDFIANYMNPVDVEEANYLISNFTRYMPSVSHVSTPTMSHKFIENTTVPVSDTKISFDGGVYTIKDSKGNKYTFNLHSSSIEGNSCPSRMRPAPNYSYYLTRVDTYLGEYITFGYEQISYVNNGPALETRQRLGNGVQRCTEAPLQNTICNQHEVVSEQRLLQIQASNGQKVTFAYSSRSDHATVKKLDHIYFYEQINGSDVLKQDIAMQYGYFGSSLNNNLRLKLEQVSKVVAGETDEVHSFSYNTAVELPALNSRSIDLWGYYNGAPNSSLLPSVGDRNPSAYHVQAAMLTAITYPTKGKTVFTYEPNPLQWSGLRIKKIEEFEADNTLLKRKRYEYQTAVTAMPLNYYFEKPDTYNFLGHYPNGYIDYGAGLGSQSLFTCNIITEQSVPVSNFLDPYMNIGISYDKVEEFFDDFSTPDATNGKIVYQYNTHIKYNGRFLLLPINAVLTEKTTYLTSGVHTFSPIKKEDYWYKYSQDPTEVSSPYVPAFWTGPLNPKETSFRFKQLEITRDCMDHPGGYVMPKEFLQVDYKFTIPALYLDTLVVTDYSQPNQLITNKKYYDYDITQGVLDAATVNTLESDGLLSTEETKYNHSNLSGLGYSTANINAFNQAKTDNYFFPTWKRIKKDGTSIFENQIYADIISTKALPVEERVRPSGSAQEQSVSILQYNAQHQPLQLLTNGKVKQAHRYNSRRELMAVCDNCDYANFAFTSFNDASGTGFSYTAGGLYTTDYYASKVAYSLSAGNISVSGFDMAKTYIVAGFIKGASVSVGGATELGSLTSDNITDGWVYFEKRISPTAATISIGGSGLIDELRFFPVDAKLRSLAYGDFIDRLSVATDEKGNSVFYEYSPDGKLKQIKDHQKNILKTYDYHFKP